MNQPSPLKESLYHTCFFVQCRFSMWISSCPGLRSAHLTTDRFVRPAGPELNTVLSKYYWKTVCNNVTCDKMENTNGRKTLTLRCCQKKEHNGWQWMTGPRSQKCRNKKNSTSSENSCDPPTSLRVTKYPSTLTHTKCCSYLLIVPTNQQLSQNLEDLYGYIATIILCLLYSHHVYITYTQYIWTIPKRWVPLTLQPLDHFTIECHGLGDPSHAPCQATWCRSRPSAAPQALAPQAPAPRAAARAPQARAQARLERAQPSAPAKPWPIEFDDSNYQRLFLVIGVDVMS